MKKLQKKFSWKKPKTACLKAIKVAEIKYFIGKNLKENNKPVRPFALRFEQQD